MDKIIKLDFTKKYTKPIFEIVKNSQCQHIRNLLDPKLRKVTCRDCGEQLDPIEVLMNIADREATQRGALEALYKKVSDLRSLYSKLWKRLKLKSRYKCRHCGKYNEATAEQKWNGEIKKIDFKKV